MNKGRSRQTFQKCPRAGIFFQLTLIVSSQKLALFLIFLKALQTEQYGAFLVELKTFSNFKASAERVSHFSYSFQISQGHSELHIFQRYSICYVRKT